MNLKAEIKKIDPSVVPFKTIYNGTRIPAIGLGTFGSDNYSASRIASAVKIAILKGYRHIDCASVYKNEKEIGDVLAEFFNFLVENKIQPIGYSPLGSPKRPERDKTDSDTIVLEDPVIVKIAKRYNVHPALICIKWAEQRGQIPIPFSVHEKKFMSNLRGVTEYPLSEEEMEEIKNIDKNCRLIKGHVFLWKEAKDWKDLWDPDGHIVN